MPDSPVSENATRRFARAILGVRFADLDAPTVEMAKHVVLDGLAVIVAGAREPLGLGRIVVDYARSLGDRADSTVITGGFKASPMTAAFANGTLAHALDFDNTWYPLNHPTSPTLPAVLALAEARDLSGAAMIEALVTAFEVQGRLRLAATGWTTGKGFHKPGVTGIMGATAASAKLLGLDLDRLVMALGIAGSRAGSLSINTGTMTKSSHSGHGARMGVECATLAGMGWTATDDVFGPGGFFDLLTGGGHDPELLVQGFGRPFRMVSPGVGFKRYPCNYFTHRPVNAMLELRRRHAIEPARIAQIRITFPPFDYVNRPRPRTGLDGKFSVQYASCVALLDGDVVLDSFTDERLAAPDLQNLLSRCEMIYDHSIPLDFAKVRCAVAIEMDGGETHTIEVSELPGFVGSPLSRADRLKKVQDCLGPVLRQAEIDELIGHVEALETLASPAPITRILGRIGGRPA